MSATFGRQWELEIATISHLESQTMDFSGKHPCCTVFALILAVGGVWGCRWVSQKAERALSTIVMKNFDHLHFAVASQAQTCCEML